MISGHDVGLVNIVAQFQYTEFTISKMQFDNRSFCMNFYNGMISVPFRNQWRTTECKNVSKSQTVNNKFELIAMCCNGLM